MINAHCTIFFRIALSLSAQKDIPGDMTQFFSTFNSIALQSHLDSWNSTNKVTTPRICFVKAGAKILNNFKKSLSTPTKSQLQGASDWKLLVDFDHDQTVLIFPPEILIELTCPAEEGMINAQIYKETRYSQLKSEILERSWSVSLMTIEVGVRGFVGHSLPKCLSLLGFSRSTSNKLCKTVSLVSAKCSYAIYLASNSLSWDSQRVLLGPAEIN